MSRRREKKTVPLSLKIEDSIKIILENIAEAEDRPVGYVARELMMRGLSLYQHDGKLKDVESKENKKP